ncbi:uncharacterized protein LOC126559958 [Anopheles maculipalpis]|uniref:uncharacterized protein LOC126559958 n=1 Tax=Anopheles maculipalpis TaxID=1496333 RepID=UPI002158EF86|nr:uncharacterized protein LOC126559958 [Anopheles maculipalpis]
MDFQFQYACSCRKPNKLSVSVLHDTIYQQRTKARLNEIVDRAWDEADPEILAELTIVPESIKKLDNLDEPFAAQENIPVLNGNEKDLAIMKSISKQSYSGGNVCACEAIVDRLSIVLDAGLAEINVEPVQEESLLEKLQLIKPYAQLLKDDVSLANFFIRLWKQAVRFYCPKLVQVLVQVYPKFLTTLVDELMKLPELDYASLQSSNLFKFLTRCLTISESFYVTLSYLAKQDRARAQPLVSACVRATKDQLAGKKYFALFPTRIRPYAIIMNEIINSNDPDLETLIGQLKKEYPHDYRILIMIYPIFCCLKNKSSQEGNGESVWRI